MIPIQRPAISPSERRAVLRVLESQWLGRGPIGDAFEECLKEVVGTRHVLAVNTGTSALHLSLACLDLEPGDEVLVPSLTFVACPQAVLMAGGTPVFCEVREDTLNLDPTDLAARISSRCRAVMPVHFGGLACDMEPIVALATQAGIAVVEDAAHAFGSTYRGRAVGSLGDLAAFSFDPIKNVTCGEGGAVATDIDEYAQRVRLMRNLGIDKDGWARSEQIAGQRTPSYAVETRGFRYHLPDINAALGLAQLERVSAMRERKRQVVARYDGAFGDQKGLALITHELEESFPFFYVLRVLEGRREELSGYLAAHGVASGVHYFPWGYPFNRTDVGWGGGSPSCWHALSEVRGRAPRPGSAPMRTAWTTWSGCGGPLASSARSAATTEAGGWAMDATGAPGAAAGRR